MDVMEIIGKEYDQLTVQDSLDEACMRAITWVRLDRPCDPWEKRSIFLVTLRISLSTGVASSLLLYIRPWYIVCPSTCILNILVVQKCAK